MVELFSRPAPQELFYRVEEVFYSPGVNENGDVLPGRGRVDFRLYSFHVLSKTPKGVWINAKGRTFIRLSAHKRYACPTIEEAIESWKARKARQRRILRARLDDVEHAQATFELERGRLLKEWHAYVA